jgi:heat shock protein HtpX
MPMNYARTALLLAMLTAIFVAMGAAVGGQGGLLIAFAVALVMNVVSLWKSDTVVLRMFKAREVNDQTAPDLVSMVRELARRAELPMPRVYIMDSPQPNAFATGRSPSHAAVCASTSLLEQLTPEEVAGVMAHELAHIKNRDTLTMSVAATIGGAVSMFAQYLQLGMLFGGGRNGDRGGVGMIGTLLAVIVAPLAAMLVQMAISRSREYQADRMGAMIAGNPFLLASALKKINAMARRVENRQAEAIPAAAHMFIINPLNGHGFDNFFSTHPNVDNRVRELEAMAREMGVLPDSVPASVAIDTDAGAPRESSPGVWVGGDNHGKSRGPWG